MISTITSLPISRTIFLFVLINFSFLPIHSQDYLQFGTTIVGTTAEERNGTSIATNALGNTLVTGSPSFDNDGGTTSDFGQARVFSFNGTDWNQIGQSLVGASAQDFCGNAVSMNSSGNIVAVGCSPSNTNGTASGKTVLYSYNGSVWEQMGNEIVGAEAGDLCGTSVAMDTSGNVVAISSMAGTVPNNNPGSVRVFSWDGTAWVQRGNTLVAMTSNSEFGKSIAFSADGNTLVVGIPRGSTNSVGVVQVYTYNGTEWIQKGQQLLGVLTLENMGTSVASAADGNTIAMGSPSFFGSIPGYVRVYEYLGNAWQLKGDIITGEANGDRAGTSVSLSEDGTIVAVGAPNNAGTLTNTGHTRVYEFNNGNWEQLGIDLDGENTGDEFGFSVALNAAGDRVFASAPFENSNGSESGAVRSFAYNGILEISNVSKETISFFPNPTDGIITIQLPKAYSKIKMTITNALGQIVSEENYASAKTLEVALNGTAGIYFVTLATPNLTDTFKLVKK
ncbi:T9SS type A sorting domain-containing protein [Aequorivita echinoideorum]|uniref:T9SS type A sorting domain-containing protein n=1 Tax=Aequorivita echinoideorum TaxID=1549647 RepID=A0ABS5S0T6_9FLAO|nr:T9SS type A sorting domain-containing protein [Aequorivita echinoideorum]MBT0606821.1 T9SS type A sorting domain-containing protein [Aequorivita echinoideorum]